ncbi:hypothetical protein BBP40_002563 [Aspergillus hancockii]|nr:hypothetical protein BBP40_002563 [Aspergillus hancockii]
MGYSLSDLCLMPVSLVPFGGLSEVDVKPGEVVIVAPATGRYGGATVAVALAVGTTIVAAGRNERALEALTATFASTRRLRTVVLMEDISHNAANFKAAVREPQRADVYIDFSPPDVAHSSLLAAAI